MDTDSEHAPRSKGKVAGGHRHAKPRRALILFLGAVMLLLIESFEAPVVLGERRPSEISLPYETYLWVGNGYMQDDAIETFTDPGVYSKFTYIEVLIYPHYDEEYYQRLNEFCNAIKANTTSKVVLQLCYFLGGPNSHTRLDHNIYDYMFDEAFSDKFELELENVFSRLTFTPDLFRLGSYDCDSFGCTGWDLSNRTNIVLDDYVFPYSVRRNFAYMGEDLHDQFRFMTQEERTRRIRNLYVNAIDGLNKYSGFVKGHYPDAKFIWTVQAIREYESPGRSPYDFLHLFEHGDIFMSIDYGRIHHNIETANYLRAYAPPSAKTLVCMNGGVWGDRHYLRGDHIPEFCLERYPDICLYMHTDIIGMTAIDAGGHKTLYGDYTLYLWQSDGSTPWGRILWNEMLDSYSMIVDKTGMTGPL